MTCHPFDDPAANETRWQTLCRWLSLSWWEYLVDGCSGWTNFWCRARGHDSVIWYNAGGLEPDMRCSRCYEDRG